MTFPTFLNILLAAILITLVCCYSEERIKREEAEEKLTLNRIKTEMDEAETSDLIQRLVASQTEERRKTVKCILLQSDLDELQDKYSAIICPHNDHVWVDGRCKKCGRRQKDA